jgi:hypothetical protein
MTRSVFVGLLLAASAVSQAQVTFTGYPVTFDPRGITAGPDGLVGSVSGRVCTAPPLGQVAWWPGDGNYTDIIGQNDGTPAGAVAFGTGEVGQAVTFAKGTAAVFVPHNASLNFSDFTIESWVNLQTPLAGNQDAIVTKCDNQAARSASGEYSCYQLFLQLNTHQLSLTLGQFFQVLSVGSVQVGVWTHVAVTRQGNQIRLYINGTLDTSAVTTAPPVTNTDPLVIGAFYDTSFNPPFQPGNNFGGSIDELSAYNRALSDSEIGAIFAAGTAGSARSHPLMCSPRYVQRVHRVGPLSREYGFVTLRYRVGCHNWRQRHRFGLLQH